MALDVIEINPEDTAECSVIWLHGLGADGHDFESIPANLSWSAVKNCRFIFPHAPVRPITVNNGMSMRGWYDILGWELDRAVDHKGIDESVFAVQQLIENEIARGIAADHCYLAGFSQGGVIALEAAATFPKPLAGVIALSTYLPRPEKIKETGRLPVFWGHGVQDEIVPDFLGKAATKILRDAGYPVQWKSYDMPHSVCMKEINDLSEWLESKS